MGEACGTNGGEEDRVFVRRKSEGKRAQGRPTGRWVDNIKMDFVET
jgi:hypothetical protein